jgi:TetR/AcrR family transcriptional regulator
MRVALPESGDLSTKELILVVARRRFADHGYAGTSLNDIAAEVGIRRPSLLHHFPSKEALYQSVLIESFASWSALVDQAIEGPRQGWPQVERMLRAAFQFFEERPDFVRLVRWEALEGGPFLQAELSELLRPLFDRGAAFLEREMDAGRLRRYDARQLLLTGYGAVLSYLSDGELMSGLLDTDPLSPDALAVRREHVIDILRTAVALERYQVTSSRHRASNDASPNTSSWSTGARPYRNSKRFDAVPRAATSPLACSRVTTNASGSRRTSHSPSQSVQWKCSVSPSPRTRSAHRKKGTMANNSSMPSAAISRSTGWAVPAASCASYACTEVSFAWRRAQKPAV